MSNAVFKTPLPKNEPIYDYMDGSSERVQLKAEIERMSSKEIEIPIIINGKETRTGDLADCVMPHNHKHRLGTFHNANSRDVDAAIAAALEARQHWANLPWQQRASIFLKAAELL